MGLQIGNGITIDGAVQIVFRPPASPTNVVPPVITGNFVTGSTVTVSNGDWVGTPPQFTYTYAWQLNSVTVPGATQNTFVLTEDMATDTITATVTATNVIGSGSATTVGYYINAWGPGQWTVSNTGVASGTSLFSSTDNYIWRNIGSVSQLSRTQDGVTWANVSVPINSPTYAIQAGNRVVIWKSGTNNAAYSSNDGSTWTNSNTVNTTTNLGSGAFDGANLVILRGDPASNSFMRSTDLGSSWANVNTGSVTNFKRDIAYGNGVFLTVGDYYSTSPQFINTSLKSTDGGATWANSTYVKGTSIAYGDGKFVTTYPFGANSNPAYAYVSSDNGSTWTQTRLPDQGWNSVVFADHHFITSEGGGNIMYSSDGVNWTGPYRTIPAIQAGSGTMAYLESQSLLLNGGAGYYVSHAQVPLNPDPQPGNPSNLNASSSSSTTAYLTWLAPSDIGGDPIINYRVDAIGIDGAANVTQYTSGPVTSYTFTGLVTGKTYYFNLAAINSSGQGPYINSEQTVKIVPYIGEAFGGGYCISDYGGFALICSTTAGQLAGNYTYAQAQGFCQALVTGGYSDWLLPSLDQMNIVNSQRSFIGGYTAGLYITSTTYNPAMPGWYWTVTMPGGTLNPYQSGGARAVRVQPY